MKTSRGITIRIITILLALVISLPLLSAPSNAVKAAEPAWTNPTALGTSSLYNMYGNYVSVAVSPNPMAQSVAVWVEPSTMVVKYAIRRNGVWSTAKAIYTANANSYETLTDPQVVIDSRGTTIVVWGSTKQGPMKYCSNGLRVYRCPEIISYAKAATLPLKATTWVKTNISAKGVSIQDVQLGNDQDGNAVAMWVYKTISTSVPMLQSATLRGSWGVPVNIYSSSAISLPRLSVSAGGALVVWAETLSDPTMPYAVKASRMLFGGSGWSSPEVVATQAAPIAYLDSAIGGNGQSAVVWDNSYSVQWAHQSGGAWMPPQALLSAPDRSYSATGPYTAYGPTIASDGFGNFLVTWLENDILSGNATIEAEFLSMGELSSHMSWPTGAAVPPSVAMCVDGILGTIAWLDQNDNNVYAVSVNYDMASNVTWGQPLLVSKGTAQYSAVWGTGVSLANGFNSNSTAVWLSASGANYQIKILGSTYQP